MDFDIGKVNEYDGYSGIIVSSSGTYKFVNDDLYEVNDVANNDYVLFRGEVINEISRAFFVKKIEKDSQIKEWINVFLLKDNGGV